MYIKRHIEPYLQKLLVHFPAIALLGPRQCGKTTLVREVMKWLPGESIYLDLEHPVDAGALQHPVEFLDAVSHKTVIIDEIQRMPELFPVLRTSIDKNRKNSRFILLGSASPELLFKSNETLAGRIVYLELTPFIHSELSSAFDFRVHWLRGGFPTPCLNEIAELREQWYKSFILSYIERDLHLLGLGTSPLIQGKLIRMLAANQGALLNYNSLSRSAGISSPRVKETISYFERSYILRLLQPYYKNLNKRLVKSPKAYIRDSGLLNYMLQIREYKDILMHPNAGALWEGYVIEQIINTLGDSYNYFFYRTQDGTECDLLIFSGQQCLAAVDVKLSDHPSPTKSMTISLQDTGANHGYYIIPECTVAYQLSARLRVIDLQGFLALFHK